MYNQFALQPEVLSLPECALYIQVKMLVVSRDVFQSFNPTIEFISLVY